MTATLARERITAHGDAEAAGRELLDVIQNAITHQPRSQQRRIGSSELGVPCTWCLAHKLAGVPEQPGLGRVGRDLGRTESSGNVHAA